MPRILHSFRSPLLLILVLLLGGSFTTTARAEGIESRNYVWDISFPLEKNRGSYEQGWHMCRDSGCTRAHRAALVIGSDLVLAAQFRRTYEAWEAAQFTSAERETEGLTAPENDAFGSGLANLALYAFGLNARAPDRSALPRVERGDDGFVFVFPRLNHADDLSYVVEVSPDLSAWSFHPVDEGQWEVIDVPETSTEWVCVTLTADPGGATHFVRLRIEREVYVSRDMAGRRSPPRQS